jgi:hypothetical protein|nr:MAG TPA: hypothetical protein [Caudoviricetes sp.]
MDYITYRKNIEKILNEMRKINLIKEFTGEYNIGNLKKYLKNNHQIMYLVLRDAVNDFQILKRKNKFFINNEAFCKLFLFLTKLSEIRLMITEIHYEICDNMSILLNFKLDGVNHSIGIDFRSIKIFYNEKTFIINERIQANILFFKKENLKLMKNKQIKVFTELKNEKKIRINDYYAICDKNKFIYKDMNEVKVFKTKDMYKILKEDVQYYLSLNKLPGTKRKIYALEYNEKDEYRVWFLDRSMKLISSINFKYEFLTYNNQICLWNEWTNELFNLWTLKKVTNTKFYKTRLGIVPLEINDVQLKNMFDIEYFSRIQESQNGNFIFIKIKNKVYTLNFVEYIEIYEKYKKFNISCFIKEIMKNKEKYDEINDKNNMLLGL